MRVFSSARQFMNNTIDKNTEVLAKNPLHSSWNNETVGDVVESWNWNCNIFEIYDQVKDWDKSDQKVVLEYAYYYFGKDRMISELASHLMGWGFE